MALMATVHSTGDGLISACAREVVEVELRPERAAILRVRTVAGIVLVKGRRCATRNPVQVRLVSVNKLSESIRSMHGL